MKNCVSDFYKIIGLILLIILAAPFLIIHAQSGKIVQPPQTVSTPISKPISPMQSKVELKSAGSEIEGRYKLIFETSFEGKLGGYQRKEKVEMMRARFSGIKNVSSQLNASGADGYRVISSLPMYMVAIVARDEAQYEYELFETESSVHFAKVGLPGKLEAMSDKGFRVIDHSKLGTYCEWIDSNNAAMGENCEYSDRFLFEREKKTRRLPEQILVSVFPSWGAKPSDELEKQISEKLAKGFYPTKIFSRFEVLLEKAKESDEIQSAQIDVQIIRASWIRDDLEGKVNELAKQGYRLAMTSNKIAMMYRNGETAQVPVSYIWVKSNKKFETNLKKLQATGAIYRTTYPNEKGTENALIFEQKLKDDGKRREFKVLKFEFKSQENLAEKIVNVNLTPSSEEAVKQMNAFAKEGFIVRDLFYSDKISVIMEREIN